MYHSPFRVPSQVADTRICLTTYTLNPTPRNKQFAFIILFQDHIMQQLFFQQFLYILCLIFAHDQIFQAIQIPYCFSPCRARGICRKDETSNRFTTTAKSLFTGFLSTRCRFSYSVLLFSIMSISSCQSLMRKYSGRASTFWGSR